MSGWRWRPPPPGRASWPRSAAGTRRCARPWPRSPRWTACTAWPPWPPTPGARPRGARRPAPPRRGRGAQYRALGGARKEVDGVGQGAGVCAAGAATSVVAARCRLRALSAMAARRQGTNSAGLQTHRTHFDCACQGGTEAAATIAAGATAAAATVAAAPADGAAASRARRHAGRCCGCWVLLLRHVQRGALRERWLHQPRMVLLWVLLRRRISNNL